MAEQPGRRIGRWPARRTGSGPEMRPLSTRLSATAARSPPDPDHPCRGHGHYDPGTAVRSVQEPQHGAPQGARVFPRRKMRFRCRREAAADNHDVAPEALRRPSLLPRGKKERPAPPRRQTTGAITHACKRERTMRMPAKTAASGQSRAPAFSGACSRTRGPRSGRGRPPARRSCCRRSSA